MQPGLLRKLNLRQSCLFSDFPDIQDILHAHIIIRCTHIFYQKYNHSVKWYDAPMSTPHKIGQRIKSARHRAGLSQAELAKAVDVTQPAISRIEKDEFDVSQTMLSKIALACGVPASSLIDAVKDDGSVYNLPAIRKVLSDYEAPSGLRDLLSDKQLMESFGVTNNEVGILYSIPVEDVRKEGYLQLLITLRAIGAKSV